jgi:hypothetical protein
MRKKIDSRIPNIADYPLVQEHFYSESETRPNTQAAFFRFWNYIQSKLSLNEIEDRRLVEDYVLACEHVRTKYRFRSATNITDMADEKYDVMKFMHDSRTEFLTREQIANGTGLKQTKVNGILTVLISMGCIYSFQEPKSKNKQMYFVVSTYGHLLTQVAIEEEIKKINLINRAREKAEEKK